MAKIIITLLYDELNILNSRFKILQTNNFQTQNNHYTLCINSNPCNLDVPDTCLCDYLTIRRHQLLGKIHDLCNQYEI